METRTLKIIKNKDGHGTINYKLSLPKKWIESLGIVDKIQVDFNNNKIIVYKENNNMEKSFKTDKRLKTLEVELNGNSYMLPFTELEKYTDTKLENLGDSLAYNYIINGEYKSHTLYRYNNKMYIIDTIKHDNTELISAKLVQLVEC